MIKEQLADYASIASLISLGLSIYVLCSIKRIERRFQAQARLPFLIKDLKYIINKLVKYFDASVENQSGLLKDIEICRSIIKSIHPKLNLKNKRESKKIQLIINNFDENSDIVQVYARLTGFYEDLKYYLQDLQFRS